MNKKKEIQPIHFEGDQPWDFFGRNDAKAETPVLWPPHAKSWLTRKDFDAGRDWGQEEKGTSEDEMGGWHHWLDGCVWMNSGSWWWIGRPGVLQFMGSQKVRHAWATELNRTGGPKSLPWSTRPQVIWFPSPLTSSSTTTTPPPQVSVLQLHWPSQGPWAHQ